MSAIISGFHHVCLKTRDWNRTMAFYQDVLGCTVKITWRAEPERAAMLDTGDGNYIEVFEDLGHSPACPEPAERAPHGAVFHFAFRTARLDEVAARVRAAGAKITMEPKDAAIATTNGAGTVPIRIFFCEGPNGESIEFFQNTVT